MRTAAFKEHILSSSEKVVAAEEDEEEVQVSLGAAAVAAGEVLVPNQAQAHQLASNQALPAANPALDPRKFCSPFSCFLLKKGYLVIFRNMLINLCGTDRVLSRADPLHPILAAERLLGLV